MDIKKKLYRGVSKNFLCPFVKEKARPDQT